MDPKGFEKLAESLEKRIDTVEEFMDRAHKEGINRIEAIAMQGHVRSNFSPKQRAAMRRQIMMLYQDRRIDLNQKVRIETLLDRASHIADEHFLKLARIVPQNQTMTVAQAGPRMLSPKVRRKTWSPLKRLYNWWTGEEFPDEAS
jgi:hypothetical protein